MKQLLILSGKGGTGKTTIASALIRLADARAYADCDVDAPNLHLVMNQSAEPQTTDYYGLPRAEINTQLCVQCDRCRQNCRFDAITSEPIYQVDPFSCEGCGVCQAVCPAGAVSLNPASAGKLILYTGNGRTFSTAWLNMGSGTSGLLVTEVEKRMRAAAPAETGLAIIDGSPGIGCPVIASMSGVNMVLIVAEPSVSGISDMERIIQTAETFQTKIAVCINKYDTNPEQTGRIEAFCKEKGLPMIGKIPFDPMAVTAVNRGKTVAELECAAGNAVKAVFEETIKLLLSREKDSISS